jgi:hypothetical protein
MKYEYTDDMGEISGFGGGYEQACRDMLLAGMKWLDDHPEADPQFRGCEGVYGILTEDSKDAEELSKAVTAVCDGCSGAMHQAVCSHLVWIKSNSWDEYVRIKREAATTKETSK